MADIELYEDDSDDIIESDNIGDVGFDDYETDPRDIDAGLTMLERLEKYCDNESMYTRQMVTRSLLETIRSIENEEETQILLKAITTLADDPEPMVRSEVMEHIPHIAIFCLENLHIFGDPIPTHLLPVVVNHITDTYNQVRKTSQAALLVLLEQDMIKRDDVEAQVCPVIVDLAQPTSPDDFRTEAAALMSKLAPLVGKEATERIFLDRFSGMCTDPLFHVRKVCATNFGDFAQVVGREMTEEKLLPKFYYLCEDGVWGVRKACAECFMQISCVCSPDVRQTELAQLFVNLICDQSRWVRMAAFQALGGFISTFADPSHTGLHFSEEGHLLVGNAEDFPKLIIALDDEESCDSGNSSGDEDDLSSSHSANLSNSNNVSSDLQPSSGVDMELVHSDQDIESTSTGVQQLQLDETQSQKTEDNSSQSSQKDAQSIDNPTQTSGASSCATDLLSRKISDPSGRKDNITGTTEFNNFQFWRMPLPVINVEVDIDESKAENTRNDTLPGSNILTEGESLASSTPSESTLDSTTTSELTPEDMEIDQPERESETMETGEPMTTEEDDEDEDYGPIHTASVHTVCEQEEEVANIGSTHVLGQQVNESAPALKEAQAEKGDVEHAADADDADADDDEIPVSDQDVIPHALLEHYLSMTDPSRAQTVDSEIARHCAYSLPAVAYTLGRKHWPCIKELYDKLASDLQWKVRRTLAFSIHELAIILGEDITSRDLVPIFNGFLKDLDEVRVGVLKHLGDFLKLLKPEARQDYLTKIYEFLNTDNTRNWRFREELALQLYILLDLYTADDITEHLVPVGFMLTEDPVAAVRMCAFKVLSGMIRRLNAVGNDKQLSVLIHDTQERFAENSRWANRQMFVLICQNMLEENSLSQEQFAQEILPMIIKLSSDPVPNVRITLSRVLARYFINSDYYTSAQNPMHAELLEAIQRLKSDDDRDVRHFMTIMTEENTNLGQDTIPV